MNETVSQFVSDASDRVEVHQGWSMVCTEPLCAKSQPVDILFAHGMAAGGWMWPPEWLSAFAGAGYRCWTLSFQGRQAGPTLATDPRALDHALSILLNGGDPSAVLEAALKVLPGASLLDGPTLSDYTDTLETALSQIDRPTVMVGHSLGGAVAQNLLRRGKSPAGTVLLCSVPPYGNWRASMEMAFVNPELWQAMLDFSLLGISAADAGVLRRNFFPGGISDREFRRVMNNIRDESLAALSQAMGFPPFAPLPGPRSDVLVIGGGRDRLVPVVDVALTALYYGSWPRIMTEAGHMPMLEADGAVQVVNEILLWLSELDLPRAA